MFKVEQVALPADQLSEAMSHMDMLERSASLASLLATPMATSLLTTDPTARAASQLNCSRHRMGRSLGILGRLFGWSGGRVLEEEERRARKQAKALRKAHSAEGLASTEPRGRKRGRRILTKKFFEKENISALSSPCTADSAARTAEDQEESQEENQEEALVQSPLFEPIEHIDESKPGTQSSDPDKTDDPVLPLSLQDDAAGQRRTSRDSALIRLVLGKGLEESVPRRYSSAVQSIRTRLASLLEDVETDGPAGEALTPTPFEPGEAARAEIVSLIDRYRFLRQFSLADKEGETPMILELLQELDHIVNGMATDQVRGDLAGLDEREELEKIDFSPPAPDLMSPVEEACPMARSGPIIRRDLSHELLAKSSSRVIEEGCSVLLPSSEQADEFTNLVRGKFVNASTTPLAHDADEEMIRIEGLPDDPLFTPILAKYRLCMQHGRTALMQSPPELSALFTRIIRQELDPTRDTHDPKHLLLVPLNETGLQRWVPPGAKFRIGRHSTLLRGTSLVVSRNHAEIVHDGIDSFLLMDVGSSSGTFVNGERLAEAGQPSTLRGLEHGDILQLGVDFEGQADDLGNIPSHHRALQLLVMLGHPRKATAPLPHQVFAIPQKMPVRDNLISHQRIQKMTRKAFALPGRLAGCNARLYLELGDLVHCEGAGSAVIVSGERHVYSAIFNNYKLNWEMAMTDVEGLKTLTLQVLDKSSVAYAIKMGHRELARITALAPERMTVDMLPLVAPLAATPLMDLDFIMGRSVATLNEVPAVTAAPRMEEEEAVGLYSITGSIHDGLLYFVERSRVDRQQIFLGEALMTTQRVGWMAHKKGVMVEMRLVVAERDEQIMLMAALLMVLLQLEQGPLGR